MAVLFTGKFHKGEFLEKWKQVLIHETNSFYYCMFTQRGKYIVITGPTCLLRNILFSLPGRLWKPWSTIKLVYLFNRLLFEAFRVLQRLDFCMSISKLPLSICIPNKNLQWAFSKTPVIWTMKSSTTAFNTFCYNFWWRESLRP